MIILIFLSLVFSSSVQAQDQRLCDYFGWNCSGGPTKFGGGRSSSQSLPSQSTASNLNPGNLRFAKGYGIEALWEPQNPMIFSFASGTGKLGGALISQTYENSFFGNRAIEIDDLLYDRIQNNQRYNNKKFNVAAGAKLIDKGFISLDAGITARRNADIGKINLGVGFSGRISIFNFGASFYNDDVKIDLKNYTSPYTGQLYSTIHSGTSYQENFLVETYSLGSRIKKLSFDAGVIKTRYKFYTENTRIYLYSAAYSLNSFQLIGAIRKEYSPAEKYVHGNLVVQRRQDSSYYGLRYSRNKNLVLGVNYNYFLLNEFSFTGTLFF